jgi:hypothetical protein
VSLFLEHSTYSCTLEPLLGIKLQMTAVSTSVVSLILRVISDSWYSRLSQPFVLLFHTGYITQ